MPFSILISWFPVVVSFLCMMFMAVGWHGAKHHQVRQMMSSAIWYYTVIAGTFVSWMCYLWYPVAYVAAIALCYFCLSFASVALYRLVCRITLTCFSWWHYALPILLSMVMLVWSSMVPFDVKLGIVHNLGKHDPRYPLFSKFFTSVLVTQFVFNAVYVFLSFRRYLSFRKITSKTDTKPYILVWLKTVLVMVCTTTVVPVLTLIVGRDSGGVILISVSVVCFSVACLIMTINVLKGNYPQREIRIITVPAITPPAIRERRRSPKPPTKNKIGKDELLEFKNTANRYFATQKPYLNPKLKLEELAQEMGYTRNSFSAMVNQAFRVNFNTLVNTWRLKELAAISKNPQTRHLPRARQVAMAGFGSYDSYQRAEQEAAAANKKRQRKTKDGQTSSNAIEKDDE